MTGRLHATCHCGKVRMTLPGDAAGVLACHCDDCRRMHGNFNAFLAVAHIVPAFRSLIKIEVVEILCFVCWLIKAKERDFRLCSAVGGRSVEHIA